MKVSPEMLKKTKDGRKKVSGFGCQVSGKKSEVRGPKSDVENPRPEIGSQISENHTQQTFCLLTPISCTSKMKVTPEMLMKTKERAKAGVRYRVLGVRKKVRGPESE